MLSGNTHYQRKVGDIMRDYCASGYEAVLPKRCTTNDGRICSNGSTLFDQSFLVFVLPHYMASRINHVREHHGRSAEVVVFEHNACINGNVVLYLHIVSDGHAGADHNVLPEIAV